MSLRRVSFGAALLALTALFTPAPAEASLTVFQTYTGNYGVSTDGFGSTTQSGTISASIPVGATIVNAYLYTTLNSVSGSLASPVGNTLNGSAVTYTQDLGGSANFLRAHRADVTSIVNSAYTANNALGIYNFNMVETNGGQDGEALVVVYTVPSLPVSTVGILDGFSLTTGDQTSIAFASALDPAAPGFFAEMRLGIGFSCCNQRSTVEVNGTTITENAGNFDDGLQSANGSLITVGGFDDPFSPLLPTYDADHERYSLVPRITLGDTSIEVTTANASGDDNVFLAVFHVLGEARIGPPSSVVPEPATLSLLGLGLGAAAVRRRFARKA